MLRNFEFPKGTKLRIAQAKPPMHNQIAIIVTMPTVAEANQVYLELTELARKGAFSVAFSTVPIIETP